MSFKSVFDSYLDRRSQSAAQEVEFAKAVSQARQTAAAEDRARTALNLNISEFNAKLPGLGRRNAIEEAAIPGILQRMGLNNALNKTNMENLYRQALLKEALDRGDIKAAERITGQKVQIGEKSGKYEFSRDNGRTWFLTSGIESGMADLNNQALMTTLKGSIEQYDYNKARREKELQDAAKATPSTSTNPAFVLPTLDPREAQRFGVPQGGFTMQPDAGAMQANKPVGQPAVADPVQAARQANMVIRRRQDGVYASPNGFDGWIKIQDAEEQLPFGFSDMQAR